MQLGVANEPAGVLAWAEVELLAIEEVTRRAQSRTRVLLLIATADGYDWTGLTQQEDQACGFCGRPSALHQKANWPV